MKKYLLEFVILAFVSWFSFPTVATAEVGFDLVPEAIITIPVGNDSFNVEIYTYVEISAENTPEDSVIHPIYWTSEFRINGVPAFQVNDSLVLKENGDDKRVGDVPCLKAGVPHAQCPDSSCNEVPPLAVECKPDDTPNTGCVCKYSLKRIKSNMYISPCATLKLVVDVYDDVSETDETNNELEQHLTPVPTLTEWGLIIFGVMLLGFITYVFLRRRKAVSVRI